MSDITDRLRRWSISTDAVPASDLMDEAAAEIERLALQCERLMVQNDIMETRLEVAVQRGRLTDAEREAVEVILSGCSEAQEYSVASNAVKIVRGLLERTK